MLNKYNVNDRVYFEGTEFRIIRVYGNVYSIGNETEWWDLVNEEGLKPVPDVLTTNCTNKAIMINKFKVNDRVIYMGTEFRIERVYSCGNVYLIGNETDWVDLVNEESLTVPIGENNESRIQ